jgi:hypothetical protein
VIFFQHDSSEVVGYVTQGHTHKTCVPRQRAGQGKYNLHMTQPRIHIVGFLSYFVDCINVGLLLYSKEGNTGLIEKKWQCH